MEPGELVVGSDGSDLIVVSVSITKEKAETYNFEVEDWHTYFVSEDTEHLGLWVHNLNCKGLIDADNWNEFRTATKGWFTKANSFSSKKAPYRDAAQGWHWYKSAKESTKEMLIGDLDQVARALKKDPDKYERLFADPWQLQVNDSWIIGGIERGATFRVTTNIYAKSYRKTRLRAGEVVESVFKRELKMLSCAGYKFVQDPAARKARKGLGGPGGLMGVGWMVKAEHVDAFKYYVLGSQ